MCVCCKSAYAEHLLYPRHFPTPDELLAYAERISLPLPSRMYSACAYPYRTVSPIDLSSVDGSSVNFFSFTATALFPSLPRLVASWIVVIVTPGLFRLDIERSISAGERPMAYWDPLDCLFGYCWPSAEMAQSSIYIFHLIHQIPFGSASWPMRTSTLLILPTDEMKYVIECVICKTYGVFRHIRAYLSK